VGVYGLRLANLRLRTDLLVAAPTDWPVVEVEQRLGDGGNGEDWLSDDSARVRLQNGGEIVLDRSPARASFVLPYEARVDELIHPLMAPVGAVMSYWLGRETFHAGGVVVGDATWGIVGRRGAGKSTLIAQLALEGLPVVADDLLVLDGGRVYAGPRSVDLRRGAAERLGVGEPLGVVGRRERWRFFLPPVKPVTQFAGWVFLTWGDRLESVVLSGRDRLARLQESRGIAAPPRDLERVLEYASYPAIELRRPRVWESFDATLARLLDVLR
jgi:hypothetical protein